MVRIVNYQQRQTEQGKVFFVLELQGGIEMVKSSETGKFYVTARKATISSTFDELTCQSLIGSELPGKIEKINCDPYEYTIKETGEIITLTHRFEFVEESSTNQYVDKSKTTIEDFMSKAPTGNAFSTNGHFAHQE